MTGPKPQPVATEFDKFLRARAEANRAEDPLAVLRSPLIPQEKPPAEIPTGTPDLDAHLAQAAGNHRLTQAMDTAQTVAPEMQARISKAAQASGIPDDIVARNLEAVEREVARQGFDPEKFRKESPVVAEWFGEDPKNAALAVHDINNLNALERLFGGWKFAVEPGIGSLSFPRIVPSETRKGSLHTNLEQGVGQVEDAQIGVRRLMGTATPEDVQRHQALQAQQPGKDYRSWRTQTGSHGFFEDAAEQAALQLPNMLYSHLSAARTALASGVTVAGLTALTGVGAPAAPETGLAAAGVGYRTGLAAAVWELEAGGAYNEYIDGGMDPATAKVAATTVGLINAGLESLNLEVFLRTIPGLKGALGGEGPTAVRRALYTMTRGKAAAKFAAGLAATGLSEVSTEVAQEASTVMGGLIGAQIRGGTFRPQSPEEIANRLYQVGIQTAKAMIFLAPIGPGAEFTHDFVRADQADRAKQQILALGETVKASKLRESMPAKFQEFVAKLKEKGPIENVNVTIGEWNQYWQGQGVDPAAVAAAVTGDVGQYFEAVDTGGDLVIPLERYATELAATEHHVGLADDIRLHQGDFTAREAKDWHAATTSDLEAMLKEDPIPAAPQSEQMTTWRDELADQLEASGMERGVAERQADLGALIYTRMAQRLGITPEALAQRYQLRVGSDLLAPTDATRIDQGPGVPQTEAFKSWFRQSAVAHDVFRGEPVPKVVYHGSPTSGIEVFDRLAPRDMTSKRNRMDAVGTWFAEEPATAELFGEHFTTAYLSIQKPKLYTSWNALVDDFNRANGRDPEAVRQSQKAAGVAPDGGNVFHAYLRSLGFDGIKVTEQGGIDGPGPQTYWVALDPAQIKSTENAGAFDPNNPNIFAQGPTSDIGHKREATTGRYVGAPEWVGASPQALIALRRKLRQLALEGAPGRFWYENSSRAILEIARGDKDEAERVVSLIALYSPHATVPSNTTMALTAYYQWKAGRPINAGFDLADQKAEALLRRGEMWSGIKTNSFYQNLMVEIDAAKLDPGTATMDMWMAIAFDYGMKELDQGPKYHFAEREVQRLAAELGWPTHQMQAAIWTAMKGRVDPIRAALKARELKLGIGEMVMGAKGKEVYRIKPSRRKEHFRLAHKMGMNRTVTTEEIAAAKTDFSDVLRNLAVQVSWEATPGRTSGDLPGIYNATLDQKIEYLAAVAKVLSDERGRDLLAEAVGIPGGHTLFGFSAWQGEVGAGAQDFLPAPSQGSQKSRQVKEVARDLLNAYAALKGLVLRQEAVVWHTPVFDDARIRHNGLELVTARALSAAELDVAYRATFAKFGEWSLAPGHTGAGFRLLNFVDGLENKAFQAGMLEVIRSLPEDFGGGLLSIGSYRSDGEYISNDWTQNPKGEEYAARLADHSATAGGPSDLLGRAAELRARVEAVNADFTQRYGWDQPGETPVVQRAEPSITGVEGLPDSRGLTTLAQSAYHGSPFRFDKFSLQHIGSGEGVQSYGWGLYFAGNRQVAEYYRRQLSDQTPLQKAWAAVDQADRGLKHMEEVVATGGHWYKFPDPADAVGTMQELRQRVATGKAIAVAGGEKPGYTFVEYSRGEKAANTRELNIRRKTAGKWLEQAQAMGERPGNVEGGQLYRVDLKPEDDEYLNWDLPLDQQSEKVQRGLAELGISVENVPGYWIEGDYNGKRRILFYGPSLFAGAATLQPDGTWDVEWSNGLRTGGKPFLNAPNEAKAREIILDEAHKMGSPTGAEIYDQLKGMIRRRDGGRDVDSAREASLALHGVGIRGVKYLDQMSRAPAQIPAALLSALRQNDNLGFDTAAQALSAMKAHDDWATRWDASADLQKLATPWLRGERDVTHNFVIFDESAVELAETYYQRNRGYVQFGPDRRSFNVTLLEGADPSTFIHELGHLYLEVLQDISPNAEQRAALTAGQAGLAELHDDLQVIRKWLGAEEGAPLTRDQHEQWARGFEAYLLEGHAPSVELIGPFARFKAWLTAIYRKIQSLNVTLTPEVRGVMDRMLASDEAIRRAQNVAGLHAIFGNQESSGMTAAEWAAYQKNTTRARESGAQALLQQVLAEQKRASQEWWRAESERVRAEVTAELYSDPAWQALHYLQRGELLTGQPLEGEPVKLSRAALVERYGDEGLRQVGQIRPYIYSKDGVDPDLVAQMFGFESGDAMMNELLAKQGQKLGQVIEQQTTQRMQERFPDMLNDSAVLGRAALDAVHNLQEENVLLTELRVLGRQTGSQTRLDLETVRALVDKMIGEKRVRDLSPFAYQQAEARAAKRAYEAFGKGDYGQAQIEKRKQLLNHLLYRGAREAQQQTEKVQTYLAKFSKRDVQAKLGLAGEAYRDQINSLLERFEFSRATLKSIDKRVGLAQWITEQEAAGLQVDIPDAMRNEAFRTNWKNLSYDNLLGLRDAVKTVEHLARLKNKLLEAKAERELQAVVDDIVGAIEANHTVKAEGINLAPNWKDKAKDWLVSLDAAHVKPEFLFRWLDGEKNLGPAWAGLFKPLADAENAEHVMMRGLAENMKGIFDRYTPSERAQWLTRRIQVPEVKLAMTKGSILSVALNWGNEGNREALKQGYGWTDEQVAAIVRHLDTRDLETVQKIWDQIDSYWPEIAALQKDLTGLAPEKVERTSFTALGAQGPVEMKGGYYPLKYDTRQSFTAFKRDEAQQVKDLYGSNWTRPATKKGHTIERVGSAGQAVKIDLSVLTEHLTNVIHDLTHRRAVIDVDRLLQDKRVRTAIEGSAGRELYRALRPWLQRIATDRREPADFIERALGRARAGATIVNMGLKFTTAVTQLLGFSQTVAVLGPKYTASGMGAFFGTPAKMLAATEFAQERSELMRTRRKSFDRDIRDVFKSLEQHGKVGQAQQAFFYMTGMMDMAVAIPTWLGAYQQGMEMFGGDEAQAIDHADSVTRRSQGSGSAKDLASVQGGSEYRRIFTMFYSYFSVLYNLMRKEGQQQRAGGVKNLPHFAASMALLWFVPAVMQDIMVGREPPKDEGWAEWIAKNILMYPFQAIVGVRDLMNGILGDYGYEPGPVFDAFRSIVETGKAAGHVLTPDKELTRQDLRATIDAVGYWGHLPTKQAWITGSYMSDWLTGKEEPTNPLEVGRNLMFSRPKK